MNYTFDKYCANVGLRIIRDSGSERVGQAFFNELSLSRPDIADVVRGSDLDPYYDDNAISNFLALVAEAW